MTFPDYPFAFARGGALLAPKLLKENFNDLMYAVYRGASLEYGSKELWACVDLWFLDKFPFGGKHDRAYHTPAQLLETLQFAYSAGFDYVYIEQVKALTDGSYALSEYGQKVVEFQNWRRTHHRETGEPRPSNTTSSDSLMAIGGKLIRHSFRTTPMGHGLAIPITTLTNPGLRRCKSYLTVLSLLRLTRGTQPAVLISADVRIRAWLAYPLS